ncbi:MAG: M23 family metallopeptidase [Trueperaceae bacterium]
MTLVFAQTRVVGGRVEGLPVSGRITSPFGAVGDARLKDGTVLHTTGHTGVDIGAPLGTEVKAPAAGKVVDTFSLAIPSAATWIADWKRIYGNSVIVEHAGGYFTLYAHLSALKVREGQAVVAGEVLGLVGSTGLSTGPHLHWGVGGPGNRYVQRDKGLLDALTLIGTPAKEPAKPKEATVALTPDQQYIVDQIRATPDLTEAQVRDALATVGLTAMPGEEQPQTPAQPSPPTTDKVAELEELVDELAEDFLRISAKVQRLRIKAAAL